MSTWDYYTNDKYKGELSGNALWARKVRSTPLTADAILDLVLDNLDSANDSYYRPIWGPIELRINEYIEARKAKDGF